MLSDGVKYEGNIPWQKNFEVLALIEIKSSLIDPRGVLVNWDNAAVDPCSWDLITCSPDGFVLSIIQRLTRNRIAVMKTKDYTKIQNAKTQPTMTCRDNITYAAMP